MEQNSSNCVFPDSGTSAAKARVLLLTWNVGNCSESTMDERILFHDEDFTTAQSEHNNEEEEEVGGPHLVFIGLQEVDASMHNNIVRHWGYSAWSIRLMEQMADRGLIMLHHQTFPGLLALLFVKYEWLPHVNLVEADNTKLMFESLVGSKGAIGVRAKVGNETICLINSHLPAHLADHRERDKAYLTILADQFYSKSESTVLNHDFVFWLGDLNFRIDEIPNLEVKRLVEEGQLQHLLNHDQLNFSIASGRSFSPFQEGEICFPPTYKFNVGTQDYDTSEKKRKPAWCDRILWRDKPQLLIRGEGPGVRCLKYSSIASCCASDHKPVYGVYEVLLQNYRFDTPSVALDLPLESSTPEEKGVKEVHMKKNSSVKFRMNHQYGFEENTDSYDWVGLYIERALKLKDYCAYKYVSSSDWSKNRVKFSQKEFKESERYRIIYHSAKLKAAVGVSCLFKAVPQQ
ncbi:phosphatidylinositol 4,5-bisphosphate 5-phosphatase A-like isoform X2 [Symsagittifera roscoffensis]|uniref:phosphatidylinositol 4,5-bisphosphate 5-phosphatase A-like isoform X2 n=1 Tax=Symsagittifera roscoffensis TaxID=84072 RepID=UPI00307CB4A2